MGEHLTQPDTHESVTHSEQALKQNEQDTQIQQSNTTATLEPASAKVIWTPRFIVIFALILAVGLSAESLLTRGEVNHYYAPAWVLFGHVGLIVGCLIAVVAVTHSWWLRVGSIFGMIWAVFISINLVLTFYTLDFASPILAYVNAGVAGGLLGMYMCFAVDGMPWGRWDMWFFRLAPVVVVATFVLAYVLEGRSLSSADSAASAVMLVLCVLVWWVRSWCWRMQPGPTFLLGLMPALLLVLSLPGVGVGETNLFLSKIALFALLLGVIRILQGELRKRG
jgi:hypothetical protein